MRRDARRGDSIYCKWEENALRCWLFGSCCDEAKGSGMNPEHGGERGERNENQTKQNREQELAQVICRVFPF